MILIRDFALFVLPILVAACGWLYALGLRKQFGSHRAGPEARSGDRLRRDELNAP